VRIARTEDRLHRVDRAGPDITEDHPEGAQDERRLRAAAPPTRLVAAAHRIPTGPHGTRRSREPRACSTM
jgi:hypothetical protein